MEWNKGQKLVKVVELMSRPGGVRAHELKERFELDARSLRRYLADLRELDLPLVDEGRGDERVLSIDPRWRRTGVQLSLAEVLSLHFGRTLFTFLDGTSFAEDLQGAIERLEPAISRAHAELSRQLDRKFLAVPEHGKSYRGDAGDLIDDIVTALVYNHVLDATYRGSRGQEKSYVLHPYTLAIFRQALYVFAWDARAGAVKTFAVERFTSMRRRRGDRFIVPADWRPEAHIEHAFGIMSGPPETVRLAFAPQVANYITERTWHPTQRFARHADGWLELSMDVAVTVELTSWIRSFGPEVRVLSPGSLRQRVVSSLAAALEQYGEDEAIGDRVVA